MSSGRQSHQRSQAVWRSVFRGANNTQRAHGADSNCAGDATEAAGRRPPSVRPNCRRDERCAQRLSSHEGVTGDEPSNSTTSNGS